MGLQDLLSGQPGRSEENHQKKSSPLDSLKIDLGFYKEAIKEVSQDVVSEGYTAYPIFVAHQHEVNLGEVILNREELNTTWTIHVSSLEEFIERGLIKEEKKQHFINQFKPASDFMCLFVIVPEGANFVYYPFK